MLRRFTTSFGFILTGLLLAICSCTPAPPAPPNIVLVVIDTLRPDHLPFHGYDRNTAPFLSGLASGGVVFEHAYSTSSWTAPATASLLTSLHPVQHGVLAGLTAVRARQQENPTISMNRIPDEVATAAEVLRDSGYSTWCVADNMNVCAELGFDQGFEHFRMTSDEGAAAVNATVRGWANGLRGAEPYFLYIHYMDPHRPYRKHAPWYAPANGELLDSISAYDSEISYVDQKLEELFELLTWDENTLLIVTSDHGEEFLDHGGWDHGRTLYSEVVEVPLIVNSSVERRLGADESTGAARRIQAEVSILDILPTMRDAAGLPPGEAERGVSLMPVIDGSGETPPARALYADLRSPPWFESLVMRSVLRERQKYILTLPDREELYDLTTDPGERTSLTDVRLDALAEFRRELEEFQNGIPRYGTGAVDVSLDDETLEKLESLGYVQ